MNGRYWFALGLFMAFFLGMDLASRKFGHAAIDAVFLILSVLYTEFTPKPDTGGLAKEK